MHEEVEEIERELAATDVHVLRELRAMRGQLDALETVLRSRH